MQYVKINNNKMIITNEIVIAELQKDAKRFKCKWELNLSEPTRSKPNTSFLTRTLKNVVKQNKQIRNQQPINYLKNNYTSYINNIGRYLYKKHQMPKRHIRFPSSTKKRRFSTSSSSSEESPRTSKNVKLRRRIYERKPSPIRTPSPNSSSSSSRDHNSLSPPSSCSPFSDKKDSSSEQPSSPECSKKRKMKSEATASKRCISKSKNKESCNKETINVNVPLKT